MTKGKIVEELENLSDEEVSEVLDFIKLLRDQPEKLTEREREEIKAGQEEFARGEWSRWKAVGRAV